MKKLLVNLLLSAAMLYVLSWIFPGVKLSGFGTSLIAALVLGCINAVIKPVINLLALPLTIVTLGLFSLVINAMMLSLASYLTPGFYISGFMTAFFASIVLSVLNLLFISDRE
ncbi:MAG: phage holin family protein [Clostridiales bacterium]|jgi:putative membrane protein|nr:phage holin family protein [Clostridiales bacterium]